MYGGRLQLFRNLGLFSMALTVIKCLLPLANTPLVEYTLEFLANAGVQEVFLYAGAHPDQVEKYIKYVPR
jgi:NDP-sugar pyrophosphorylase family protein